VSAALAAGARDLLAYSAQLGVVVVTGLTLSALLRLRAPGVRLALAQGLLLLAVALPWLQPWAGGRAVSGGVSVATTTLEGGSSAGLDVWPAVGALFLLGAAWRLARLVGGLWRLRRYRRLSRPLGASPATGQIAGRVGVAAYVAVSDEVEVPAAFGFRRPVVLLPARFTALDPAVLRAVLCHELLHVRRRDWLQMLAEEVAGALLWFHPAVWWLLARIRLAREQVVDLEAVRLTRERRVYLQTLVSLARVRGPSPAPAPLFLRESHLKRRVDVLLEEVTMSRKRLGMGLAASVAGVAVAGVAGARAFPLEGLPKAWASAAMSAAAPGGIQEGGGGSAAGKKAAPRKPIHKVNASYPEDAKKKGIEGPVSMDVLIGAAGEVKDVKVIKGPAELAESAMGVVRQWKFEPGPTDTRATLTINYVLDKAKEK
jgi:TonB family protein